MWVLQSLGRSVGGNEETRHTPQFQEIYYQPDEKEILVFVSQTWGDCTKMFVLVSDFLKVNQQTMMKEMQRKK